MKTPSLSTVYLDNEAVSLMGDPYPPVSKIVAASGKRPESVQVLRALSPTDLRGKPVGLDETIDRTAEPTKPIYLTSKTRRSNVTVPMDLSTPDGTRASGSTPTLPGEDEAPRSPLAPLPGDLGSPSKGRPTRDPSGPDAEWHIPPSKGSSKSR